LTEARLKIAVFIDFDNIEIGVKTTLGQPFDISAILEGIKERGEVITKVAYGDWKRAGDHGRLLSQHAIRMVQRNLTPGGDKNGADINLALDALEMAFTHDHINAFVIVGGDSDFITLVEKLKQYDKKVFVVGGRQFTSLVMQKNCHEFIAYENLVGTRGRGGATEKKSAPGSGPTDVAKALPLVKRALKVLVDREVSPQLGLLKSTLLQLDSTFSEKDYGASTFRDFIEKVAQTGLVTLRHAGRSLIVDLADTNGVAIAAEPSAQPPHGQPSRDHQRRRAGDRHEPAHEEPLAAAPEAPPAGVAETPGETREASAPRVPEALDHLQRIFARAPNAPRWPMYVRQVKQFLRGIDDTFDERAYGFATIVEFLRACQRENLLRLERDRQGVLRVFAGPNLARTAAHEPAEDSADTAPTPGAGGEVDARETEPAPAARRAPDSTEAGESVSVSEVDAQGETDRAAASPVEVVDAEPVSDVEPGTLHARQEQVDLPVRDVEPGRTEARTDLDERSDEPEPEDVPVARPPMSRRSRKTAAGPGTPRSPRTPRARTTPPGTRTPAARGGARGRKKAG
jgi:uncharacterized LabA/DUF88 family protein